MSVSSSSSCSHSHTFYVFVSIVICLVNKIDEDVLSSLPLSRSTHNPQICLKEFQYHSLEEKDCGHEITLKDSGIDTASSSTILNILSTDPFKQVYSNIYGTLMLSCLVNVYCI
jgi:hypothetical protein